MKGFFQRHSTDRQSSASKPVSKDSVFKLWVPSTRPEPERIRTATSANPQAVDSGISARKHHAGEEKYGSSRGYRPDLYFASPTVASSSNAPIASTSKASHGSRPSAQSTLAAQPLPSSSKSRSQSQPKIPQHTYDHRAYLQQRTGTDSSPQSSLEKVSGPEDVAKARHGRTQTAVPTAAPIAVPPTVRSHEVPSSSRRHGDRQDGVIHEERDGHRHRDRDRIKDHQVEHRERDDGREDEKRRKDRARDGDRDGRHKERERERERDRGKEKERERLDREREKEQERDREREKEKEREKERDRERARARERERTKEKDGDRRRENERGTLPREHRNKVSRALKDMDDAEGDSSDSARRMYVMTGHRRYRTEEGTSSTPMSRRPYHEPISNSAVTQTAPKPGLPPDARMAAMPVHLPKPNAQPDHNYERDPSQPVEHTEPERPTRDLEREKRKHPQDNYGDHPRRPRHGSSSDVPQVGPITLTSKQTQRPPNAIDVSTATSKESKGQSSRWPFARSASDQKLPETKYVAPPILPTASSAIDKTRPPQFVSIRAGQGPSDSQTYDPYKPTAPSRSDFMTSDSRSLHYKASKDMLARPDPGSEVYTDRRKEIFQVATRTTQSQDHHTSRPNDLLSSLPTTSQVPALVRTAQPNTSNPRIDEPRSHVTRTNSSDSPKYSPQPPSPRHPENPSAPPQTTSHRAKTTDPRIVQHPITETSYGNRMPQVPSSRQRHQSESEMMPSNPSKAAGSAAPPISQRAVSRDGPVVSKTLDLATAEQASSHTASNTVAPASNSDYIGLAASSQSYTPAHPVKYHDQPKMLGGQSSTIPNVTRLVADFESRSPLPVQTSQLGIGLSLPRSLSASKNHEPPHSYTKPVDVSYPPQGIPTQIQLRAPEGTTHNSSKAMSVQMTLGNSQETATVTSQRPTGYGSFIERDPSSFTGGSISNLGPFPQRYTATPILPTSEIDGTSAAQAQASASLVYKPSSDDLRKAPSKVVQDIIQSSDRPSRPLEPKYSPKISLTNEKPSESSLSHSHPALSSRPGPSRSGTQSSSGHAEQYVIPHIQVTAPHTPPKTSRDYSTMPEMRSAGNFGSSLRVDLVASEFAAVQLQPRTTALGSGSANHDAPSPARTPYRLATPTLDAKQGELHPERDLGNYSTVPTSSQTAFRHPRLSELLSSPPQNSLQAPRNGDGTFTTSAHVELNQTLPRPAVSTSTWTQTAELSNRTNADLRSTSQPHVSSSDLLPILNSSSYGPSSIPKTTSNPISHSASRNTQSVVIPPVFSIPYSDHASDSQVPTRAKESIYSQHMPTLSTSFRDAHQSLGNNTTSVLPQSSSRTSNRNPAPVVPSANPTNFNPSSQSQPPQPMATSRAYESVRSTTVANSPWILPPTSIDRQVPKSHDTNVVQPQYAQSSRFGSASDNALQSSQVDPVSFHPPPPVSHSAPYHPSPRRQPTVSLPSSTVPPSSIPPPSSSRTLEYASGRPAATGHDFNSQTTYISKSGYQSDIAPSRSPRRLVRKASSESLLQTPSSLVPSILKPTASRTSNPEPSQPELRKANLFQIFRSKPKTSHEVWHPPESSKDVEQDKLRRSGKPNADYHSRREGKLSQTTPAPIPIPSSSHHKSHSRNFNPFGSHLTPSSKPRRDRDRTMSAVSAEAVDGTAPNTVVGSPTTSNYSQAPMAPPPLRDPVVATHEWRDREEAEIARARRDGKQRRPRPGVVFNVVEEFSEDRVRPGRSRTRGCWD